MRVGRVLRHTGWRRFVSAKRSDRHILNQILKENNMLQKSILALLFMLSGNLAYAGAQPSRGATRGELLYSTHCITCHSTQVHWRDKKLATDWTRLQAEVRRWQEVSGLGWVDDDITEVARYLNVRYYHYPNRD
jgi:mono/diheme cytochrome c family protein